MSDHTLALREAIIAALRANAAVAAFVGARVYESIPDDTARPFLRYGVPITVPFEATGIDGSDIDVTIHVFDEAADTNRLHQIMKAVKDALDEASLTLSEGYLFWMTWTGSQPVSDEGGKNFRHGIVQFNAVTGQDPA